MAFFVGTVQVYPGLIPTPNETNRGAQLFNDGTYAYWTYPGEAHITTGTGWRYRTLLTHGYIAAGYKGSNPWRSVNKTWHQTDTTVFCGEQIDKAGAYVKGTFSDLNGYVHATSDVFQGVASHTSSYNLFNGVMRMQNDTNFTFFGSAGAPYNYQGNNPSADGLTYGSGQASPASTGGWDFNTARNNFACASTQGLSGGYTGGAGYSYGGSTTVTEKLNFPTEVMYTTTTSPVTWGGTDGTGGQLNSYILGNSNNTSNYYMSYSNDTFTSWSAYSSQYSGGSDGNNKSLMSKYGWGYFGVGGNTNTAIGKFSDVNQSYIAQLTKLSNFGEENQQMGQDWGYMLGQYNGQQSNWSVKTTYSNDSMVTLGATSQPKGHYGTSSGATSSAAASVCSAQRA
jgi:hypothetical protein